ncbi:MAG: PilZ domain-containing protein [Treponema sp.]|jgi:hypothetical protein|nr:PilZ domain-containing protein [Treponema sp.]
MEENEKLNTLGKKVFFLHPSALTQNQIIAELAQEEFEVYVIKDGDKLRHVLMIYPDSILFANINENMKEDAWEALVKSVQTTPQTSPVQVGIIASASDENLKHKYLDLFKVQCGYTVIKSDVNVAIKQLTDILNNVNAKGRRKYIRMIMDKETNATVNLPLNGTFINGVIKDISVVGFSCSFAEDPKLQKNSLFNDIQLRLQSQLLKAEGIIFGSRMDGAENVYVVLFTQRVDPSVRTKIRKYIQTNLQNRIDQELK